MWASDYENEYDAGDLQIDKDSFGPHAERVMLTPLKRTQRMLSLIEDDDELLPKGAEKDSLPNAERVMEAQETKTETKPGGDGKMKLDLNLKDLDGNPSDLTIGAAAVGMMHRAVESKGPDDGQVNAVAGFGHGIMQLVAEIEKADEKNEDNGQ